MIVVRCHLFVFDHSGIRIQRDWIRHDLVDDSFQHKDRLDGDHHVKSWTKDVIACLFHVPRQLRQIAPLLSHRCHNDTWTDR